MKELETINRRKENLSTLFKYEDELGMLRLEESDQVNWSEDSRSDFVQKPLSFLSTHTGDQDILHNAEVALVLSPYLVDPHVEVQVRHGEVFLDGFVRSRRDKRIAESCVENILGVSDVFNRLNILCKTDLNYVVNEAIRPLSILKGSTVMPKSNNIYDRSVRSLNNAENYELSGESEYSRELSNPFQMVDYMIDHGVDSQTEESIADHQIRDIAREVLARDTLLGLEMISVDVVDGILFLTGEVSKLEIKRLAELSVENLAGVQDIINQLKVSDGTRNAH